MFLVAFGVKIESSDEGHGVMDKAPACHAGGRGLNPGEDQVNSLSQWLGVML